MIKEAISTERALKLALEALAEWKEVFPDNWDAFDEQAITALREALAEQPAQQKPWGVCVSGRVFIGALPEYVRKLSEDEGLPIQWLYTSPPAQRKPLTLWTEPQQGPYCYMDEYGNVKGEYMDWMDEDGGWFPVYKAPLQRQPLTDDEIESINVRLAGKRDLARLFARAIEAAHGIKEKNT